MAYGEANGHAIDDVMCPWKVKLVIQYAPNISKTAGDCEAVRSAILATAWLLV